MWVLPADGVLLVFYFLLDSAEFFQLFIVCPALILGFLRLFFKLMAPLCKVTLIIRLDDGTPRCGFAAQLFNMDNFVCSAFYI